MLAADESGREGEQTPVVGLELLFERSASDGPRVWRLARVVPAGEQIPFFEVCAMLRRRKLKR